MAPACSGEDGWAGGDFEEEDDDDFDAGTASSKFFNKGADDDGYGRGGTARDDPVFDDDLLDLQL